MFGAVKNWLDKRREAKEIVAIVFLLETPRLLTPGSVEQLLGQAGVLSPSPVAGSIFKEEQTSYLRGVIDGFELTIASSPQRYAGLSNPRQGLEARLADGMTRHQGFITIDCWKAPEGASRRDARPMMAKMIPPIISATPIGLLGFICTCFFIYYQPNVSDQATASTRRC